MADLLSISKKYLGLLDDVYGRGGFGIRGRDYGERNL